MSATDGPADETARKTAEQAVIFANRLDKRHKHLRKWARRTGVSCFRVYDRDIPEIPLSCDLYEEADTGRRHLLISLYERPYEKDEAEEERWLLAMKEAAADILSVDPELAYTRMRKRQRGESSQYERVSVSRERVTVIEGGSRFLVDLSAYLDTGLFLDHRPARAMVRSEAEGKRVLNLFCYTGAFSVHAAAGGASSVTSVDISNTYLSWAAENLTLNGFAASFPSSPASRYPLVREDVKAFLAASMRSGRRWDLIVCDPPTFSNSKRAVDILDVNRDWASLCRGCLALLAPGGSLYFSSNSRSLKFDPAEIGGAAANERTTVRDLTEASIPEDFRDRRVHRLWKITVPS